MLKIQEFMNSFDDILDAVVYLKRNLQIEAIVHPKRGKKDKIALLLLKPALRADMTNPLVKEAHCLVLDNEYDLIAKAWDHPPVISKPEQLPQDFDLTGAICEEIADGETIVVYNIDGSWHIGTDANHEEEIKRCLSRTWASWDRPFQDINPFLCFVFNYITPYADNVMPILTPTMYLTGVINLENNIELSNGMLNSLANKMDVGRPNWSEINGSASLSQRLLNMRALAPGLMLRDKHDHRVIIPNPIYKAVKNAKEAGDRIRPTHIANILQSCRDKADIASITAAYDSYAPMLKLLSDVRFELTEEVLMLWSVAKHSLSAVDFAHAVQHHSLRYLLFMRRHDGSTDLVEEVKTLKPIKLTRLTENKYEKEYSAASKLLKFTGGTDGNSEAS